MPAESNGVNFLPGSLPANVHPVVPSYAYLLSMQTPYLASMHDGRDFLPEQLIHGVEGLNEGGGFVRRLGQRQFDVGISVIVNCGCAPLSAGENEGETLLELHCG